MLSLSATCLSTVSLVPLQCTEQWEYNLYTLQILKLALPCKPSTHYPSDTKWTITLNFWNLLTFDIPNTKLIIAKLVKT